MTDEQTPDTTTEEDDTPEVEEGTLPDEPVEPEATEG